MEKEALVMLQRAFEFKTQICIGPYSYEMIKPPKNTSPTALEVEEFMDRALRESGPKSVFYVRFFSLVRFESILNSLQVSFGSIHWTPEPEKVWAIIDILLKKGIYFVSYFLPTAVMS